MTGIRVISTLTPRDVARVSRTLVLRNPASMLMIAVGPVCLAIGAAAGSATYTRFGMTLVWLVGIVPAFAWLAGTYNAYRPGARELYVPVIWTFAEEQVEIAQPDRVARAEWGEFRRWRSAGGSLLLHTSQTHYVVLPWRDVADDDREPLEALLRERLGPRKR